MSKRPSVAEPVTELRKVKIKECHEPLVNFLEVCPTLILDRPRFNYQRETLLRRSVAERLCAASELLPHGYRLGVIEGWRPPHIQHRMYRAVWRQFKELHPDWSEVKLKRVVNQYSAPLDPGVPPPHVTGGAIDVILLDEAGKPHDLHSPYDWREPRSFAFDAKGLSDQAQRNRAILRSALTAVDITNYPSEYWHYSHGDQGWAYRNGHPHAIYGAISPPDWHPDPMEDTDEPLEFVI